MKTIVEKEFGGDGAKAALALDGGNLVAQVSYPIAKLAQPLNDIIDKAINGLEAVIPGDWDKALLEPARVSAKAEILKLLSE